MARKKTRDDRKLATGHPMLPDALEYAPIAQSDWLYIEQQLQNKVPETVRTQLSGVTELYFYAAHVSQKTIPVSTAKDAIGTWMFHTRNLRNLVWPKERQKIITDFEPRSFDSLLKHLCPSNKKSRLYPPLEQFADFLNSAECIGNFFSSRCTDISACGVEKAELWFVWAALIIALCNADGLITVRKSNRAFSTGFLMLITKLQTSLIESHELCARTDNALSHIRMPVKTGESLKKALRQSLAISRAHTVDQLFANMALSWSLRWWDFDYVKIDIAKMDALRRSLQSVMNIRRSSSRTI